MADSNLEYTLQASFAPSQREGDLLKRVIAMVIQYADADDDGGVQTSLE